MIPRLLALALLCLAVTAQMLPWINLSGDWRFYRGDDARFADAAFDDSRWETVRLPGELPVQHGESFWIRRTLQVPPGVDRTRLSLTLGKLSENYELFIDGKRVWSSGFAREETKIARPRTFNLPSLSNDRLSIAIRGRRHMRGGSSAWIRESDSGPYLLTDSANAPRITERAFIEHLRMQRTLDLATGVLLLTLAVILMLMFASQRSRRELLWLALCCAATAWTRLAIVLSITVDGTPWDTSYPSSAFSILLLLEFSMAALDYSPRWIRPLAWVVFLWGFFEPVAGAAVCVLLPIVLVGSALRRSGRSIDRLFVTFGSAVLLIVHIRTNVLSGLFGIPTRPFSFLLRLGPYEINSYPVLLALFTFGMVAVLIRRLLLDREQKQRLANEIEAARAVQQLLLASAPAGDGQWTVDAIYEPAQEVGGDFYQVLSRDDGSRVILVGDVSGKGLNAAMLVSFAVGALQNQTSSSPAAILQAMNTAVNGHARGKFITCCCVRVRSDGEVTVASAGHPPPYADSRELPVDSGLPLGVHPDSAWAETSLILAPGAQVTLVSDGVVEARNARGELFGFERTRDISGSSAAAIAAAAGAWGQDDDITVVTVRRAAA